MTLHKYLTNIYLCWEFALPTSSLLSISGHFKRFQLSYLPSHLIKLANIFYKRAAPPPPPPPPPPSSFFCFYGPVTYILEKEYGYFSPFLFNYLSSITDSSSFPSHFKLANITLVNKNDS